MKVMGILHDSAVDGEGLRTVVFFAGCSHHCKGCHNPQSWDMDSGQEMTVEEVLKEIEDNPLTNVTFSGGDPFFQAEEAAVLAKGVKALGKNLWVYTGFTYEQLLASQDPAKLELLKYCDVLVDGRFVEAEKDLSLSFRGSRNQRIIRMKQKSEAG